MRHVAVDKKARLIMNVPEEMLETMGYDWLFNRTKMMLERHFGPCELLLSTNALQYDDYDKYESEIFDKEAKYRRHSQVFPEDCRRAFDLGARLAAGKISEPDPIPK